MNITLVLYVVGHVLCYEAVLMLLPIGVALLTGVNDWIYFVYTIVPLLLTGLLLRSRKPKVTKMQTRDGLAAVAFAWIFLAAFGALPFYFSGYFNGYVDCFFETVSGFTTTGATILTDIEGLHNGGLMFWRSFTHWIGGMGILVFVLAFLPNMDGSNVQLLKAESPGPTPGKMVPRLKETARILYLIYFGLTIAHILCLVAAKMPLYDSVIHAMGSAGTGGFSNMNASVGAYHNPAAEWIIAIFMMLFGVNFSVYYLLLKKQVRDVFKNGELRLYLGIIVGSVVFITLNIAQKYYDGSWSDAIRSAFFQVSSIMTTTGYSTTDFNLWPTLSKMIIVTLMIVGACAGSTGGGVKVSRVLVLFKSIKQEIRHLIHPRMISSPRMDGKVIEKGIIKGILIFFFTYIMIAIVAMLVISVDGYDIETTITAVLSALGNIGPGLGAVGPMGNFAGFSQLSKVVLSFCMLAGRLELFPMLILFVPSAWKKSC
ncbi:TrkH family potassium uptake protein [Qiania dongpingensis]|uniref:TrkH family potassium uptake protein n=1 Tax=Qiania dongpingensis TaxID=2763669 RepID=A0A7G9G0K0_9FIRM|nr:TrkH family potassium uptake protein [Qiania dongpingensis]QNM04332.1 TrkH family potassium uptake protein [Qiania dongpingensis]